MGTNYVGNFGWGESGGYSQQPGDQTGSEGCVKAWYLMHNKIDGVLRYPDVNIAAHVASDYAKIAKGNLVGYDMSWANGRNTLYEALKANGWNVDKYIASGKKTECDCSSGVYAVWCCYVPKLREYYEKSSYDDYQYHNCTTTYVMREEWKKAGFAWLTDDKYCTSGDYQIPGDVYVNISHHTNMAVNYGAKTGKDQTINYSLPSAPTSGSDPVSVPDAKPEPPVTVSTVSGKFEITASSLNIRANHNTSSSILGDYKKGDVVTVVSKSSNGWYKTDKGWISGQYIKELIEQAPVPDASTTEPAAAAVEGKDAKYKRDYVCTTAVCLHRSPDVNNGSVIDVCPEGRKVRCYGFFKEIPGRTMLCILDLKTGKEGWISMKCLKEA